MEFPTKADNDEVVMQITLSRIDTASAPLFETSAEESLKGLTIKHLTLDVQAVEYISSAGLRVILRLIKAYPDLSMVNVCADLYDILEMTGFTEMISVEKAMKQFSVEGCKVLGAGAKGTVYRVNVDTIIKVYHNPDSLPLIKRERELARKAFVLGIPTAISYDVVKVGESFGSVFELLDCNSISQELCAHPERFDEYVSLFTQLLKTIHETRVNPSDMPDVKVKVNNWLETDKPLLTETQYKKLAELIKNVPDVPYMLHCDYHTNNVMMQGKEAICIDMDTLSHGHPVFELANIRVAYIDFGAINPAIVEKFMGLPYEACQKFWNSFLRTYFFGKNAEEIAQIEQKIQLVAVLRVLSHFLRRSNLDDEESKAYIQYALEEISRLLAEVDSLLF